MRLFIRQIGAVLSGLALLLASFSARAIKFETVAFRGGADAGGGDEIGLEFQQAFAAALQTVKSGHFGVPMDTNALEKKALNASVIVVDTPILIKAQGFTQESAAMNEPSSGVITINRKRWQSITDVHLKEAIALHEMLSLLGLEHTGYYEVSAKYAIQFGISPWLVSGQTGSNGTPVPKTLSCHISYLSGGGQETSPLQEFNIQEKLFEDPPQKKIQLRVQKSMSLENDRFQVFVWGVQPFQTAFNVTAYEYTGINIVDHKTNSIAISGPTAVVAATENNDHAIAMYEAQSPSGQLMIINADCSLH